MQLIILEMLIRAFSCKPLLLVALRLLLSMSVEYGLCCMLRKINPYEEIFLTLLREPPINMRHGHRDSDSESANDAVKEEWLEQPLDHFDSNNTETWLMRYLVNDHFYRIGAPVFVFVGGEWEILPHVLQYGHFHDMARQQEALMFYTEHRFYGRSWPKRNTSAENLKYLNVLQSLGDLKRFLTLKKTAAKHLQSSKVVLVGGSYSGSMVAWFMKLYPELATVAWASSAPLIAKMDFRDYMTSTMSAIDDKGGFICGQKLQEAFSLLADVMQEDTANYVSRRLNMCKSFDSTNPLNLQAFFNGLGNYFASLVQSYSSLIPKFCTEFANLDRDPLEALIKYLTQLFVASSEAKLRGEEETYCLDFSYEGMKAIFANETETKTGTRPWFYQTCHEFGWFTTTAAPKNSTPAAGAKGIFGGLVSLSYFQQLCQDVFGNSAHSMEHLGHGTESTLNLQLLHNRALAINKLFGGLSNVSERVIFTHGSLDPWRAAGLQQGQNVLLIEGYSHVEDMGSIDFSDTVEMNVVKLRVAAFVNRFLRSN